MNEILEFPQDFVFGVATAAYQVEGHIENDWSEWERAGKLKDPAMRCGKSVDHWNRYEEDLTLIQNVSATAYRMSLEWARIEPRRGQFDDNVLAAYRQRVLRLRELGIRPIITLHHYTHPSWFHRETPWHEPECLSAWRRYVKVCVEVLRGTDPMVITFNEPMPLILGGYLQGLIPPGINEGAKASLAVKHLAMAHIIAREELRSELGDVPMGISQNVLSFAPDRFWHPIDRALTRLASWNYNHAFIDALHTGKLRLSMPGVMSAKVDLPGGRESMDFIGINYYTRAHLRFVPRQPFLEFVYLDKHQRGLTHIGWEDYPEGFGQILLEMRQYGKPVWVTENGIDDRDGNRRPNYLYEHWKQLLQARKQGVDIRGYLYWSLMDNFEWLEGWGPRFGLYQVDFNTLERKATAACHYFKRVASGKKLIPPNELLSLPAPAL